MRIEAGEVQSQSLDTPSGSGGEPFTLGKKVRLQITDSVGGVKAVLLQKGQDFVFVVELSDLPRVYHRG
jgi:hypothetical protein